MNDFQKTIVAVVIAAGLASAAYLTRPAPIADARFSDQGEPFFVDFKDPTAARVLQVLAFDEAAAAIRPFKTEFDGTRWVIPSHYGYPADAEKNMAEAAAVFIGLEKQQFVTDSAADHEALGVLSPDDVAGPLKGRGTRVTLSGEGGSALADLIVGKQVKTTTADPSGSPPNRRYVRLPGKNRVYAVDFAKTFSTAFVDWVETDLLKISSAPVSRIIVDRYEVDEKQGVKRGTEKLTMSLSGPAENRDPMNPTPPSRWTVVAEPGGPPIGGETVNTSKIEEMIGSLRALKIAGVRPKPQKLADWFAGRTETITQMDAIDLQSKGFFTTNQGQFVGNQGETVIECADGVVYTMYFGEVLFGEGDELSAGTDVIGSAGGEEKKAEEAAKGQESRYAFVAARFDERLIPMPERPAATVEPASAPETPAVESVPAPGGAEPEPAPSPSEQPASVEAAKDPAEAAYQQALAERAKMVEAGKKRAESLSNRFANWYYVIDAASFGKMRLTRSEVVSKPETPATTPAVP